MKAIVWTGKSLKLLDQRHLPHQSIWLTAKNATEVAHAIEAMVVRGAPAIAIAGAYGLALATINGTNIDKAAGLLMAARPTAVNLKWAIERCLNAENLIEEAECIHREDVEINTALAHHGAPLLSGKVITICNTGALATGGLGTALGMITIAAKQGRLEQVYAMETRPYLQGARLTAYECQQQNIPCTLIADSMAGALMASKTINAVVAGCDRVAANGDTANKIGTYGLAVLAHHHNIPFYIAMPMSTLDLQCPNGTSIPIEERNPAELRELQGIPVAPHDIPVWNPGFDVTPRNLITSFVTEKGIWHP